MINPDKLRQLQAEREARYKAMEKHIATAGPKFLLQFLRDFNSYAAADAEVMRHIMTGE